MGRNIKNGSSWPTFPYVLYIQKPVHDISQCSVHETDLLNSLHDLPTLFPCLGLRYIFSEKVFYIQYPQVLQGWPLLSICTLADKSPFPGRFGLLVNVAASQTLKSTVNCETILAVVKVSPSLKKGYTLNGYVILAFLSAFLPHPTCWGPNMKISTYF